MNHLTAAQKGEGGGWHYVSLNRRTGGYPLGYCAEHEPHPTEQEARECYGQWMRDHIVLDGRLSGWSDCRVCKGPTKKYARVDGDGYRMATLCEAHLTQDDAVKQLHIEGAAGDAWES